VDEAGYGSIAGPLVVAAVAFLPGTRKVTIPHPRFKERNLGVRDSKKLPHAYIPLLVLRIREVCLDAVVMTAPAHLIDELGGTGEAHIHLMRTATLRLLERIAYQEKSARSITDYKVIVDGEINLRNPPFHYFGYPKADDIYWQVSCASILAKGRQLQEFVRLHESCPIYLWDKSHGYPTKAHRQALKKYGVSEHHRKTCKPVKELL
jgi:ribonuclease HII